MTHSARHALVLTALLGCLGVHAQQEVAPAAQDSPNYLIEACGPPTYPRESKRLREEGQVLLTVRIGPDGTATDITIKQSSGFPRLDAAAMRTAGQCKYEVTNEHVGKPFTFSLIFYMTK